VGDFVQLLRGFDAAGSGHQNGTETGTDQSAADVYRSRLGIDPRMLSFFDSHRVNARDVGDFLAGHRARVSFHQKVNATIAFQAFDPQPARDELSFDGAGIRVGFDSDDHT
jgi:hypothetical protein